MQIQYKIKPTLIPSYNMHTYNNLDIVCMHPYVYLHKRLHICKYYVCLMFTYSLLILCILYTTIIIMHILRHYAVYPRPFSPSCLGALPQIIAPPPPGSHFFFLP